METRSVIQKWDSVEKFDKCRFFHETFICATLQYLHEVVPDFALKSPLTLEEVCKANQGALALVRYLRVSGLPWLLAHQAVRSNSSRVLDNAWHHSLAWFRMTNKSNYQEMVVLYMCILAHMRTEVQEAWTAMRTVSLTGHSGSNSAWDFAVEKLNRAVVMMTMGPTGENVQNVITKLTGIRHVEAELLKSAFRFTPGSKSKDSSIDDNDMATVVGSFKDRVGKNFEEFCSPAPNRLGTKSSDAVLRKWETVQKRENLEGWVRRVSAHTS